MSILKDLQKLVSTVSPVLGTALGGPFGGAIGALIAKAFGSSSIEPKALLESIKNDPNAALKLQELILNNSEMLERLANARYDTVVEDRKSAREHNRHGNVFSIISILLIVIFGANFVLNAFNIVSVDKDLSMFLLESIGFILGHYAGGNFPRSPD